MYSIEASKIVLFNDAGITSATFGDGTGNYVRLEIGTKSEAEDKALGLDGLYVELNDQAHKTYNGVVAIEASDTCMNIHLNALGRRALGTETIRIGYSGDGQDVPTFVEQMVANTLVPFRTKTDAEGGDTDLDAEREFILGKTVAATGRWRTLPGFFEVFEGLRDFGRALKGFGYLIGIGLPENPKDDA
ncbi:MAG: hypothetical protein KDK10_16655 [Maritimibacter sp.]|nr:hypothetical protein [Maritimibacter sp.]